MSCLGFLTTCPVPAIETSAIDLDTTIGSTLVGTTAVALTPPLMPMPPRLVQLPKPVKRADSPQSFTTLNELFNDPALFILKRVAGLESTSGSSRADLREYRTISSVLRRLARPEFGMTSMAA